MVDIENRAETEPKNLLLTSSTSEDQSTAFPRNDILDVDFYTSISSVVPTVIDDNDVNNDKVPLFSIWQIKKNLFILSLTFVLLFTAYNGISALQSSLNVKGNVGVNSLIIMNALAIFSSIFLTGISMDILGLKWTIVIGGTAYILYIIANIQPLPSFMYITATLIGFASSPLWISQATYINHIARYHSYYKQKKVEVIISLFFGIFFAVFATNAIWGNLISYFVLIQSNQPQRFNCGIHFNPQSNTVVKQPDEVSVTTRYVLCGIFAGMGIIAIILSFLFLDQIRLDQRKPIKQSLKKSIEVFKSLFRWKHIDQLFLVPLTMWATIESSFLAAQFTRAFVTCLIGIRYVGLVMICNGICQALCSYIFGSLVKYIGRLGCFIIAAVLNYAIIILMYLWEPNADQMVILFIIASIWGVASAVWQSQVVATYTVLHLDHDPNAIAKYRFWKSIGSLLNYSFASVISIRLTLFLLFGFLTVSMVFYGVVEIHVRRKRNQKESQVL